MGIILISIGTFIVLLGLLVVIRAKLGNRFEIRTSDIVLALIPLVFWLFLSGRIQELSVGDLRIVAAIQRATMASVTAQVTKLPVEPITTEIKGAVDKIPELAKRHIQALSFTLGQQGYYGSAIKEYFRQLSRLPSFKYIVFNNVDGTFFGMANAAQMSELFTNSIGTPRASELALWLSRSDQTRLSTLPGFIPADRALRQDASKETALRIMDTLDEQILPVVSNEKRFIGVVDRARLTASVLVDIADRL